MGFTKMKTNKKRTGKKSIKKLVALTSTVSATVQILRKRGGPKWEVWTCKPRISG